MKKRTIYLLAVSLCLATANLIAQEDFGFDISKYKTPDISRKGLDIEINLNNDFTSYSTTDDEGTLLTNESHYYGYNNIYAELWLNKNTRKKISEFSIWTDNDLTKSGNKDILNSTDNSLSNFDSRLYVNYYNQLYFQPKFFVQYSIDGNANFNKEKETALKETKSSLVDNDFYARPAIGVGMGRREIVTDARHALYILEALKNNNVLSNDIDSAKIDEFAKVISTIKNKRFLDARLRKIEELTTVDEFLKSNNLLESSDISYFTALNDMWEYGGLFERESGYELSLINSYENRWTKYKRYDKIEDDVYDYNSYAYNCLSQLMLSFNYWKPVKLNWQHHFHSMLFARINRGFTYDSVSDEKKDNNSALYLAAHANYTLGYYPNTRTNIYSSIVANYSPYAVQEGKLVDWWSARVELGTYYYFSPHLRLSGKAFLENETEFFGNKAKTNRLNPGFEVTLAYSVF